MLDETLRNIADWVGDEQGDLVFGESVERFLPILRLICGPHNQTSIVYTIPAINEEGIIENCTFADIKHLFQENIGLNIYIADNPLHKLYTSPRDGFTCLFVKNGVPEKIKDRLDRRFHQHIKMSGVGFGVEGVNYFRRLVSPAVSPIRLERILKPT